MIYKGIKNTYFESLNDYLQLTMGLQKDLSDTSVLGDTEHVATVAICVHKIETLIKSMPEYFQTVTELMDTKNKIEHLIDYVGLKVNEIKDVIDDGIKKIKSEK